MTKTHQTSARINIFSHTVNKTLIKRSGKEQNMVISILSSRSHTGWSGNIQGNSHGERERRGPRVAATLKVLFFSSEKNLAVCPSL